jgi:hypothetical protein
MKSIQQFVTIWILLIRVSALSLTANDFHQYVSNMNSLDIKSALDVVEKLDSLELEKPIFGNRPIMHHILNLYFLRKNRKDRDGLVYLMHKLISLGINVRNFKTMDPDIMFKALFIREMSLSKEIAF